MHHVHRDLAVVQDPEGGGRRERDLQVNRGKTFRREQRRSRSPPRSKMYPGKSWWHSIEVAFALLTPQPRVRILALPIF